MVYSLHISNWNNYEHGCKVSNSVDHCYISRDECKQGEIKAVELIYTHTLRLDEGFDLGCILNIYYLQHKKSYSNHKPPLILCIDIQDGHI